MSEGLFFLGAIILVCFRAVLCAAIWRAVLHPERGSWAYLRFGVPELLILAMQFAIGLLFNLAFLPLAPVLFIAGALVAMHQWVAAIVVGVISFIAMVRRPDLRRAEVRTDRPDDRRGRSLPLHRRLGG